MRRRGLQRCPDRHELLAAYLQFLREHRGLSDSSLRQNRKGATEFLDFLDEREVLPPAVTVDEVDMFLREVGDKGFSSSYIQTRIVAVRGLLRFLHAEGWHAADLAAQVEGPRVYREATVPPHFTWEELRRLVASIEGDSPLDLRDRALLVLLCVYGLRSVEVARLTLDDLDWSARVIRVNQRKAGDSLVLPMVPVVQAVLEAYARNGRPADASSHRELFLSVDGKPRSPLWVTTQVHFRVRQAGLQGGRGAHAIRRAVGTRLVEQGLGVGEVACLLGHQRLQSTRVYLRLSMELLRDVADNYAEVL